MKLFVELMKERRDMNEDAAAFRKFVFFLLTSRGYEHKICYSPTCFCREILQGRYFYTWSNEYQLMMDVAMMQRMVCEALFVHKTHFSLAYMIVQ